MTDKRGSLWKKWDLHIHTPDSIKHDYQSSENNDQWESFIQDLESLPKEFKVIGINDYIFLDGYKKVLDYKSSGRLENIELVLPVIEFRIDKFTQKNQRINYHVIFSDELAPELIEEQFITELKSKYKLVPGVSGEYWDNLINRKSLEELGSKIIASAPEARRKDFGNPLDEGFHNINVSLDHVEAALNKACFKNKVITAIGKTEWADYKWNDTSIAEKKNIINSVDLVFISAETPEAFNKAKSKLTEENVNDKLIDCSDAHTNSWVSNNKDRIGNAFTWIKADATFAGLNQVLIEPDRVFIGDIPPSVLRVRQNPTKYINSLAINKINGSTLGETWFQDFKLDLNHELVAIIGNKGNGKSAIADTIGLIGNTHNFENFSFLAKKKFKNPKPYNRASNFEGELIWSTNTSNTKTLDETPDVNQYEKVKYLPQNYLESLCVNEDEGEFEKELQKVIFSHLADDDKLNKNSLDELIDYQSEILTKESEALIAKLKILNKEIQRLEAKKSSEHRSRIEGLFNSKQEEKEAHLKIKPEEVKPPTDDTSLQEKSKKIAQQITQLREQAEKIQETITLLEEENKRVKEEVSELSLVRDDIKLFVKEYEDLKTKRGNDLGKYEIDFDKVLSIKSNLPLIEAEIASRRKRSEEISQRLDISNQNSESYKRAKALKTINELKAQLDAPSKKFQEYLTDLSSWEKQLKEIEGDPNIDGSLKYYAREIAYLDNELESELKTKQDKRIELSKEIYEKKEKVLSIYKSLFAPISTFIEEYGGLMSNYEISLDASLKLDDFEEKFFNIVSRGAKGSFIGTQEGEIRLAEIIKGINFDSFEEVEDFQKEILRNLKLDTRFDPPEPRTVAGQLRQNLEPSDLYDFIFSLNYLTPYYLLKLDTKRLEELSPGERGALLLIFYLILDKDTIPLIIDQPEENLDNNSVYNILVHFIKEAKKRRQVIIVTHNPNLAVVCDAEQVICMSIDKKNGNKVSYEAGAIENPSINNRIVEVLEGTYPAFDNRTDKYSVARKTSR